MLWTAMRNHGFDDYRQSVRSYGANCIGRARICCGGMRIDDGPDLDVTVLKRNGLGAHAIHTDKLWQSRYAKDARRYYA